MRLNLKAHARGTFKRRVHVVSGRLPLGKSGTYKAAETADGLRGQANGLAGAMVGALRTNSKLLAPMGRLIRARLSCASEARHHCPLPELLKFEPREH